MEDYNEKVNYGSEQDRLTIITNKFLGYGSNLFDRKTKRNLLFAKTQEQCEEGKNLLLTSNPDLFESFKERIKHDLVVTNQILVEFQKHGEGYFSIPTINDLYKVSLFILKNRIEIGYIQQLKEPEPLGFEESEIEFLPEPFRKDAKEKFDHQRKLESEIQKNNKDYNNSIKAIEDEDGATAWRILGKRSDYEYERIEIIQPNII